MRFATWNVNSVKARLPRLLDWLAGTAPDVVCLQETKVTADGFPEREVAELGYATAAYGQGRWNGVALLSRIGLDDVRRGFAGEPGYPDPEARAISARCGGIRFMSVYVPNGRTPDDPHYTYKLQWLAALRDALVPDLKAGPLVVAGDYNVAPTDADVWDVTLFAASTHVTPPERAALAAIRDIGLADIPARPLKGDHPFTYWDYRAGMFHQNKGMRIDLVYGSADVTGRVSDAYVDREARKGKGPSDHAPIVVDLTD
ncbi:exodeoxyribonuclease III [Actinoplanes philippinensis]|uniref:Exodeoxyribonuclease-3 n=1 Tax=Actinoplanes philippinensis TaxID=35752 RepID=A0A1I2D9N4_9ACTN|nr:exodeoxyribonuclease III [Actinoplanes philippinensis]GIE74409.1 exodeoxyribonuclease III [Actinoplanes philippinensis]SFE76690.1 exodeoxyribonuclease-3 [Actinoplanes philippinensis]